ncbi:MAG: hypothetical protein ABIJ81_00570 [Patescibacteria group bacterium]
MLKKGLLTLVAIAVVVAMIPMFAAFEAHVVNVTAKIENALTVDTAPIEFGTVFPEEVLYHDLQMDLSGSFVEQSEADEVTYVIKQKPKCWSDDDQVYGRVIEVEDQGEFFFECIQSDTASDYEMLPVLCPYLSKNKAKGESDQDGSIDAFHGNIAWTPEDTESTKVSGSLSQLALDIEDSWVIDLHVPCFAGSCAQDNVIPEEYQADPTLEHEIFGCDLWVEVTGVSRIPV